MLTLEGKDYTIVNVLDTGSLLLTVSPVLPTDVDLALILDGEKFFTSEARRLDGASPFRTNYRWSSVAPRWSDGQEVELSLGRAKTVAVDVMTATMTAGDDDDNGGYRSATSTGSLFPDTFSVGGVEYTVEEIYRETKEAVDPDPAVDELRLVLNPGYPTDFTLRLWGVKYDSSDAAETDVTGGGKRYTWANDPDDPDDDPVVYFERRQTFRASIEAEVPFLYDDEVPSTPSDLTVAVLNSTQVLLAWTAPDSDGGLPITGYQIEMSSDPGYRVWGPVVVDNTGTTDTSYVYTELEPGATLSYRVRARNLLGRSEPSDSVEATTPVEESCDIYCATMTSVEGLLGGFGYSASGAFPGSALSVTGVTLAGTGYTVNGLINVTGSGLIQFLLNSLPPESAVEGLSLYGGNIELPFREATRDTANNFFEWTDTERFSDTIFPVGTVAVRIDKEFENVVTIAAKTASVEFGDTAEFTMTRTGNLANGLLVKVYYEEEEESAGCVWFGEGERTLTAKHYASDRDDNNNKHTSVTFRVDPYVADEYCGSRANGIRYELPYKVGSANSAAVMVTP